MAAIIIALIVAAGLGGAIVYLSLVPTPDQAVKLAEWITENCIQVRKVFIRHSG